MLPFGLVKCVYTISRPTVGECMQSVRAFFFQGAEERRQEAKYMSLSMFHQDGPRFICFSSGTEAFCGRLLGNIVVVRVSSMLS